MIYYNAIKYVHGVIWCGLVIIGVSCNAPKNYTYFRDVPDSSKVQLPLVGLSSFKDPLIRANDILQISILTLDPQSNVTMSSANATKFSLQGASSTTVNQEIPGFMVDSEGNVELPIIGKTFVKGLTTTQAKDSISAKVATYYKNPVVNVRFANFSVTILGEVNRPGSYTVPNEKVSILDAIGMAGDLTIFGKRENILLVRDSSNNKQFVRLNLTSSTILQSPYYYLQQGDVLYVEPNKTKAVSADAAIQGRNYALIASIVTVLVIIFSRI